MLRKYIEAIGLIIGWMFLLLSGVVTYAGDLDPVAYSKQSPTDPRRVDLRALDGKTVAYTTPDPLDPRRTLVKSPDGKVKGYYRQDKLDPRRMVLIKVKGE